MAGNPVWGKAFHEGLAQGRIEGVVGSAVVVAAAGAAYGAKKGLTKLKQWRLEKLESQRIEETLKRECKSKNSEGPTDNNPS